MECFMELALTSKVLIGCRLSSSQKAEIVDLLNYYQPGKVTLAIGDGINDTEMLSRSSIAVSLHGKPNRETSEGANNSIRQADFALAQFKHLKPLLLLHGREAYRKNTYIIFFVIYKALLFTLPIFLFGMIAQFNGVELFNLVNDYIGPRVTMTLVTVLPAILYGMIDTEYERETLLKNPELYSDGPNKLLYNNGMFLKWIIYAIV
jgi:magnesium-transporting ATPase (P-type)